MNLRVLEYVIGVAEHGSVTRAAEALRVSQPALSKAIHQLEEEWETLLFHRVGRRLVLTDAGRKLVEDGRALLTGAQHLEARVRAAGQLVDGELVLAVPPEGAVDRVPELLAQFHTAHPHVRVRLLTAEGELGVLDLVRLGAAELGISWVAPPDAVESREIGTMELAAAFPPGTVLENDPVTWAEITTLPMIVPLDALSDYTQSNPAPLRGLNVRTETAARPLMIPLVLAGTGVAIMERGHAERAAKAGAVVAALDPPLSFPLWLFHRKSELTPAAEAFCDLA